jgi:hypothetical protein
MDFFSLSQAEKETKDLLVLDNFNFVFTDFTTEQ